MWTEVAVILILMLANVVAYAVHHLSILHPALRFGNIAYISNIRSPDSAKPHLSTSYWLLDSIVATHLVDSWFLSSVFVLLLRSFEVFFFALTLLVEGTTGDGFGDSSSWFTFFTNWTFIAFGLWSIAGVALSALHIQVLPLPSMLPYFPVAPSPSAALTMPPTVQSLHCMSQGKLDEVASTTAVGSAGRSSMHDLVQQWSWLSLAYCFLTEVVATSTLFLSIFFWAVLYKPGQISPDNLLKHGINNGVILADVLLTRVPFVSYHFQITIWYGSAYLVFMWVWHGASAHWVYYVLDWSTPLAVALYLALPPLLLVCATFWFGVAVCREYCGSRWVRAQDADSLGLRASYEGLEEVEQTLEGTEDVTEAAVELFSRRGTPILSA